MLHDRKRRLKLYSRLAQAVVKCKLTLVYRLWTVARALDDDGRGWVTVADLRAAWPQSWRTIRGLLNRGAGLFWHLDGKYRIRLRSLDKVCVDFGTTPGMAVELPFNKAIKLASFRAACYAALFFPDNGRTISRWTLGENYNVTSQTQRNWEERAGVYLQSNVVRLAGAPTAEEAADLFLSRSWGAGSYLWNCQIWRQMPNTFYWGPGCCWLSTAAPPKRSSRRAARALSLHRANVRNRLYYDDDDAAVKALNKRKTNATTVFVRNDKADRLGAAQVWHPMYAF